MTAFVYVVRIVVKQYFVDLFSVTVLSRTRRLDELLLLIRYAAAPEGNRLSIGWSVRCSFLSLSVLSVQSLSQSEPCGHS